MKLITHLDPSQLRLGYLTCLSLVAGRQLDTRQGLVDRLTRFLFSSVDTGDPRWQQFIELADASELVRITPPPDDKEAALHEIFRVTKAHEASHPLHVLWLAQRKLSSHLGLLAVKNAQHILDMGRSFELLTTGYALSEKGVFLQNFARHALPGVEDGHPLANPFDVGIRPAMQLFFLYALMSADIFTPYLLQEFTVNPAGDRPNSPKLIGPAADRMAAAVADKTDISNIEALRDARTYGERLQRKGVAKNQAQPRYHHLFELGLLDRQEADEEGRRVVPSVPNDACRRAAKALAPLCQCPEEQQNLLDQNFFNWTNVIYDRQAKACDDERRQLLYFARGFNYLEREIGFTPGRTIALAGCLLAWEDGWIVEVQQMFELMRRMAASQWRTYLEYSGGSRLDQEFLIKIKPGLIPALEKELR